MNKKQALNSPEFLQTLEASPRYKSKRKKANLIIYISGGFLTLVMLLTAVATPVVGLILTAITVASFVAIWFAVHKHLRSSFVDDFRLSQIARSQGSAYFSDIDPNVVTPYNLILPTISSPQQTLANMTTGVIRSFTAPVANQSKAMKMFSNAGNSNGNAHTIKTTNIIAGADYALYEHQYTTGNGKNQTVHQWTIAVKRLPRKMPNILIDSKSNNAGIFGSNLPVSLDKDQRIDAGALSQTFDVYVPDTYDVDVLSVISPEVIESMIQFGNDKEIEIIDDLLFIYSKGKNDPDKFAFLYHCFYEITRQFEDNLRNYRDERATTVASRSTIAQEGLRLQSSIWARVFGVLGAMLFGGLSIAGEAESGKVALATVVIVAAVAPFAITYGFIQQRKRRAARLDIRKQRLAERELGPTASNNPPTA